MSALVLIGCSPIGVATGVVVGAGSAAVGAAGAVVETTADVVFYASADAP